MSQGPRHPILYKDFAIRLASDGRGGFVAQVLQPGGTDARFKLPAACGDLARKLPEIERQLRERCSERPAGDAHRHLRPPSAEGPLPDPEALGEALFQSLFGSPVGRGFLDALAERRHHADRGVRLRLVFDLDDPAVADLAALPWELLYDREHRRFLSRDRHTPVVRFLEGRPVSDPPPARLPLRILGVMASPRGLPPLALDGEGERIRKAWERHGRVEVELLPTADLEALRDHLLAEQVQVLHFMGHGEVDSKTGEGRLLLAAADGEAEAVSGSLLAQSLEGLPSLRLVVLNACSTGCHPRRRRLDPSSGVATALVRGGVPAVVAMQLPISDQAALTFSGTFYRALAKGDPVEAAMAEGRLEILRRGSDPWEWATPALYLSALDGRLFDLSPPLRPPWRQRLRALRASPGARTGLLVAAATLGAWGLWEAADPGLPYRTWRNPSDCPSPPGLAMRFIKIEPGSFRMGSDEGARDERPAHHEEIEEPFCLGAFELTRRQWRVVMGELEGAGEPEPDDGELPASGISWRQARELVDRLTELDPASRYRLPTEAEWEVAARAGGDTAYSFGDDPAELPHHGNCRSPEGGPGDGYDQLAPVGSYAPNPWGLWDLHGNVFEWTRESYEPYPSELGPPEPLPRGRRVRRGGSFDSEPASCRSAARSGVEPDRQHHDSGLRVVREVAPRRLTPPSADATPRGGG